jgi:hypothetical protein
LGEDGGVVAGAGEWVSGVEFGFATEPGGLAFGVVAVSLLGAGDGLGLGEFVAEDGGGFDVAEGCKGAAGGAETLDELTGLFEQAAGEHAGGAGVDAPVEQVAGWREREAQDAIAGEGVAALLPLLGEGAAGGERDLDGADCLGDVVGMDALGGCGVEAAKSAVEMRGTAGCGALAQEIAQAWVLRGRGKEAVEQGAGVKAGTSGQDREDVALGERGQNLAGVAGIVASGRRLGGVVEVEQVVWDEETLFGRGFGGADLHVAVDGDGVAGEDLGGLAECAEMLGECKRECGFAGGGGAEEGDKRAHRSLFQGYSAGQVFAVTRLATSLYKRAVGRLEFQ